MQCLRKYEWVKLMRKILPEGKGIMADWAKLAAHAAYRNGEALYCGHTNKVVPGMWSGGIVGLKKILENKNKDTVINTMNRLSALGYVTYSLDKNTKHLIYQINDWIDRRAVKENSEKSVYAVDEYGFICIPRNITERLTEQKYKFEEADAWIDLWCHTVFKDSHNAFSQLAPSIQYKKHGAIILKNILI